jgi:hypothetical protein
VPPKAWFDEKDNEWVLGARVDGKLHGDVTYWRPDGTKCNECHLVHGVPHGPFKRFHENGEVSQDGAFENGELHGTRRWFSTDGETTEQTRPAGVSDRVWRSEMDYVHGNVVAIRHYDREGRRVLPSTGEPYPERPPHVDEGAEYVEPQDEWHHGAADGETQHKVGRWRRWNREGRPLEDAHYEADERHGKARLFVLEDSLFDDEKAHAEVGEFHHGRRVGPWELHDANGRVLDSFDYGDPSTLEQARLPAYANTVDVEALRAHARALEQRQAWAEALVTHARVGGITGDLAAFTGLLRRVARPVRPDVAERLAEEVDAPANWLGYALLDGAQPAVVLNAIGVALDQRFQSRAALDFTNAAMLLAPERGGFLFTRALILMSLGLPEQALRDANALAAEDADRAEFLLSYVRGVYPRWDFTPATEPPECTYDGLPEAPARDVDDVAALQRKYATRLVALRSKMLERLTPAAPCLPPDLSGLLPDGPVALEAGEFEVEDADGETQKVTVDEALDLGDADLPSLFRLARADWVALTWLCWAAGLAAVGPITGLAPPKDFGLAAGMSQQRLWRARDQRAFRGRNAAAQGAPSFEWEGVDVAELSPPVAGIAEQQYAEMQALFHWLTDEAVRSPWQDNLRGS